jgi:hypothetical protein
MECEETAFAEIFLGVNLATVMLGRWSYMDNRKTNLPTYLLYSCGELELIACRRAHQLS